MPASYSKASARVAPPWTGCVAAVRLADSGRVGLECVSVKGLV